MHSFGLILPTPVTVDRHNRKFAESRARRRPSRWTRIILDRLSSLDARFTGSPISE